MRVMRASYRFPGMKPDICASHITILRSGITAAARQRLGLEDLLPGEISGDVTLAVAQQAIDNEVAPKVKRTDVRQRMEYYQCRPVHSEIVKH